MRRADETRRIPTSPNQPAELALDRGDQSGPSGYQAPALIELGSVRNVVLGSSGKNTSDGNSGQYYYG